MQGMLAMHEATRRVGHTKTNVDEATKPFEYLHMDFCDMPMAENGDRYILVIVCDLSGTVMLVPSKTRTAADAAPLRGAGSPV